MKITFNRQELSNKIAETEKELQKAKQKQKEDIEAIPLTINDKKIEWEKNLEKAYPMPEEPCPPGMTPQQFANKKLQDAIYETLRQNKKLTMEEIREKCNAVKDLPEARISALVRQMLGQRVERVEEKRKAYFKALP
jgi:hypothetical protein